MAVLLKLTLEHDREVGGVKQLEAQAWGNGHTVTRPCDVIFWCIECWWQVVCIYCIYRFKLFCPQQESCLYGGWWWWGGLWCDEGKTPCARLPMLPAPHPCSLVFFYYATLYSLYFTHAYMPTLLTYWLPHLLAFLISLLIYVRFKKMIGFFALSRWCCLPLFTMAVSRSWVSLSDAGRWFCYLQTEPG